MNAQKADRPPLPPPRRQDDPPRKQASGVAQLLMQLSRRVLEKRGVDDLHAVQWSALRYFSRAGRRAATVMGLANYLGNTTGSASRTVRSLVERGLIEGNPLREDARSVVFTLTVAGVTALGKDPLNDITDALSSLDERELTQLADTMDRVHASIRPGAR